MKEEDLNRMLQAIDRGRKEFDIAYQNLIVSIGGNKDNTITKLNDALRSNMQLFRRETDQTVKAQYLLKQRRLEWALRQMYQYQK